MGDRDSYESDKLYTCGDRVEIHPSFDAWMMGDRYGEITKARNYKGTWEYTVKLDKSARSGKFNPWDIRKV